MAARILNVAGPVFVVASSALAAGLGVAAWQSKQSLSELWLAARHQMANHRGPPMPPDQAAAMEELRRLVEGRRYELMLRLIRLEPPPPAEAGEGPGDGRKAGARSRTAQHLDVLHLLQPFLENDDEAVLAQWGDAVSAVLEEGGADTVGVVAVLQACRAVGEFPLQRGPLGRCMAQLGLEVLVASPAFEHAGPYERGCAHAHLGQLAREQSTAAADTGEGEDGELSAATSAALATAKHHLTQALECLDTGPQPGALRDARLVCAVHQQLGAVLVACAAVSDPDRRPVHEALAHYRRAAELSSSETEWMFPPRSSRPAAPSPLTPRSPRPLLGAAPSGAEVRSAASAD